jgi:hypothetical protein
MLVNPSLGLSSTYLAVSLLVSFLLAALVVYFMRRRSLTSISYKTFGIVFVVLMTLFVMRKII